MADKEFKQIRNMNASKVDIHLDSFHNTTCDVCEKKAEGGTVSFDVMDMDSCSISYFDICRPCLLRALIELEDLQVWAKKMKE